jgi:hypothetical protein
MSEKKYYEIGATTPEAWEEIHAVMQQDGTLDDNIPSRAVELADSKEHSPTRATYLLTDEEAEQLRNCPSVKFVNLDPQYHPEQFYVPEDELKMEVPTKLRFSNTVRNYQRWSTSSAALTGSNYPPTTPTFTELNRTGYQKLRCSEVRNPWLDAGADIPIVSNVPYTGDGSNVDVICCDNGAWIAHTEFINRGVVNAQNPPNYRGGNKLPGNGYCDVLDLVLDAPYYIDPDWFNADPDNRLITRWDGTIVPEESTARSWWGNAGQRSPEFSSIGTVFVTSSYTRDVCHGSPTTLPSSGDHGTQCASLMYGRTHGWAFNANKWHINTYGTGAVGVEQTYDICKLFHLHKPVNARYGTRDPSITNHSYGYRVVPISSGWAFHRGTSTQFTTNSNKPLFLRYIGQAGDAGRLKGEFYDNSITVAGDEAVAAGVIFVVAAGNSTQKQVGSEHPDFDNYFAPNETDTITSYIVSYSGISVRPTVNRRGFPQHVGKTIDYDYPAINVGALDDEFLLGKECKVNYSDMGEQIDCYAPADGTLAATRGTFGVSIPRFDNTYTGSSILSRDVRFSGTSAACPVTCGLIATVLEYNRAWTYQDIRTWLQGLDSQDAVDFYSGTEATTANAVEWTDFNNTQGSTPRVIYQAGFDVTTLPLPALSFKSLGLQGLIIRPRSQT